MRGPDNFETGTKETGGKRNVVYEENDRNVKEIKQTVLREADTRSMINRIRKHQASFFWPRDEKSETRTGI